jgi:ABC-type transport system involved in cytochrome bd biosynthesis fused ATPase/permease subunit
MNLEGSAASLLEQFPDGTHSDLKRQERNLERFGSIAFGGFGVVIVLAVCGMIYWIVTKAIISGDSPLAGILLVAFIIFAALTLAYVILRESLNEKRAKLGVSAKPDLPAATTGKLLRESTIEPAPSIIENTTAKLKIEK